MPNQPERSIVPFEKVSTSPFGRNSDAESLLKRVERIASAVYLVTNHIKPSDVLVQRVRVITDEILTSVLSVKDGIFGDGEHAKMSMNGQLRHVIALLRLLHISGHISEANTMLLVQALDGVGTTLSKSSVDIHHLTQDDVVSRVSETVREQVLVQKAVPQRSAAVGERVVQKSAVVLERKSTRTQHVMDTLSKETPVGIKDICVRFPEYSEKMVQRELAELVEKALVKKIGEKRWSRYVLV